MANNSSRDFKGVWIPKEIWLSEELNIQEKCLLVEIDSLATHNECFASNEHFSKFLGLSKDRISRMISGLKSKGFIETTIIYKEGSKEIDKRIISTIGYRQKQLEGYSRKHQEGIGENNDKGIGKNTKDNNTVINNTINNTHTEQKTKTKELCVEISSTLSESISEKKVKSLVDTYGIEKIRSYLESWDKFKNHAKQSQASYFIYAIENDLPTPAPIQKKKDKPDYANFEQRDYQEDEFEKYYANLNM